MKDPHKLAPRQEMHEVGGGADRKTQFFYKIKITILVRHSNVRILHHFANPPLYIAITAEPIVY